MNVFSMDIESPITSEHFDDVVSFSGRDSSGSFGILPFAERRMTVLTLDSQLSTLEW